MSLKHSTWPCDKQPVALLCRTSIQQGLCGCAARILTPLRMFSARVAAERILRPQFMSLLAADTPTHVASPPKKTPYLGHRQVVLLPCTAGQLCNPVPQLLHQLHLQACQQLVHSMVLIVALRVRCNRLQVPVIINTCTRWGVVCCRQNKSHCWQ